MLDKGRRMRRLFYLVLAMLVMARVSYAATPAMTTIADTVYRADGGPATGTLLISWPAFTMPDGTPVAAGTTSVQLGAQGQLSVNLVPNTGANPAATYYSVVYQLGETIAAVEVWKQQAGL